MRLKKQKRHRRAVRFYTACFGFRQPFKVLCDGTFLHHLFINRISPADDALSNILGGPVKLFTTSCVIAELRRLSDENRKKDKERVGEDSYFESLKIARKLAVARCDHDKVVHAADCMMKIIGEKNSDHFFVATQDVDLRKNFQQIPGVPLIFGLRNAVLIEPPSAFQREFVRSTEEQRLHMTEREYKMLNKRVKEGSATEEATGDDSGETSDANEVLGDQTQDVEKKRFAKKGSIMKDKPQFKRKKAKGPNPLSCKKKKSQGHPNTASAKEGKAGDGTLRSRSRKRKRSRGGKNVAAADS